MNKKPAILNTVNESADVLVCPHCHYINDNIIDYLEPTDMDGEFESNCIKCNKPIKVTFYSIIMFKGEKPESE